MNHLRILVAKNLHQIEVIRPRLASRFEPVHQNNWPNFRDVRRPVLEEIRDEAWPSNEPTSFARASTPARPISRPVLSNAEQGPAGQTVSRETEISGVVQNRGRNYRLLQPVSEPKNPISYLKQRVKEKSDNAEADQVARSSTRTPMAISSITPASSRQLESRQKGKEPSITEDFVDKSRFEKRISAEADLLNGEKILEPRLRKNESEEPKSVLAPLVEGIAPLQSVEELEKSSLDDEMRIMAEPTSKQREIEELKSEQKPFRKEIATLHSKQDNKEKVRDSKRDIQHKDHEISALSELERPRISPRVVVTRPVVKNYIQSEKNEEKTRNLERKPDVLVTIGRIEVKAMPLPAISQRKQEKPPVTSLEDYLKDKRGGL